MPFESLKPLHRRACIMAIASTLAGVMAASPLAQAQDGYPSRPIRLVLGFAAGGPTDVQARLLADKLGPILGQTVVVDNKPGASTTIALGEVSRAPADGYTLYFGGSGAFALTPLTMPSLPYDPAKSFKPIAMVGEEQVAIAVNPSVPANNIDELKGLLKANPGKYSFAGTGQGDITHMTGELFKKRGGNLDMVFVPYKGAAPAVNDVLAGHMGIVVAGLSSVYPFHLDHKLRVLAITSAKRVPYANDIPTMDESGFKDFVATSTLVLIAPARTPANVIATLSAAVTKATAEERYGQEMRRNYVEPIRQSTPEATGELLDREMKQWSSLVQSAGLQFK